MNLSIILVVIVIFSDYKTKAAEWDYQNQDNWPETCYGNQQSPINIDTENVIYDKLDLVKFLNYDTEYEINVVNNGHTVEVTLNNPITTPKIYAGALHDMFSFNSLHFHWKSEHTIDDYRFPLETHFVHFADRYQNLSNALNYPDGVAVLGVFSEPKFRINRALSGIVNTIPYIKKDINISRTLKQKILLKNLLPSNVNDYFFYKGSLTTPNCNQGVLWTVFKDPAQISISQLRRLTIIRDAFNRPITTNFRHIQDLNERKIYANFDNDEY